VGFRLHITEHVTLRQAVSAAGGKLAGNGDLAATAARDAELLLLHTLGIPRSTMYAYPGRLLSAKEQAAYTATIERRMALEPVQYITGRQEFFGLEIEVAPGVLIPRPETELLVEAVLQRLPHDQPLHLLDVGTGSGAIAVAVASRLPRATVTAVDVSAAALEIARRNVQRFQMEDRVRLMRSDLLSSLAATEERFDAVLSNPPYVRLADRSTLHPQVRDFEPAQALFAGEDGLEVYRRLIPAARAALVSRGLLAMEIGFGQSAAIAELLRGWLGVQIVDDLQGIPRVALAWRA
jgi:release factor glutamine methyltransferase